MGTHPIFESDFDCLTEWEKLRFTYYIAAGEVTNRNLKLSRLKFRTNFLPNSAILKLLVNQRQKLAESSRFPLMESSSTPKQAAMDMLILMLKSTKSLKLSLQPLEQLHIYTCMGCYIPYVTTSSFLF